MRDTFCGRGGFYEAHATRRGNISGFCAHGAFRDIAQKTFIVAGMLHYTYILRAATELLKGIQSPPLARE